jgi:hypothetical protein
VGNKPVKDLLVTEKERVQDTNGKQLVDFASFNTLHILNSFYRHKEMHAYRMSQNNVTKLQNSVVIVSKYSNTQLKAITLLFVLPQYDTVC